VNDTGCARSPPINGSPPLSLGQRGKLSLPTPIRPPEIFGVCTKRNIRPRSRHLVLPVPSIGTFLGLPPWGRSSPRCVRPLVPTEARPGRGIQAGLPVGIAGTLRSGTTHAHARKSHDPPLQSLEPLLEAPLLGPSRAWPPHRIRRALIFGNGCQNVQRKLNGGAGWTGWST